MKATPAIIPRHDTQADRRWAHGERSINNSWRGRSVINLLRLALCCLLCATSARAATQTAASTSYADVHAALTNCSNGDALQIPAGTNTWSSALIVTNNILIYGAGTDPGISRTLFINGTTTNTGNEVPLFKIIDASVTVSNIWFRDENLDDDSAGIEVTARDDTTVIAASVFEGFSFGVKVQAGFGLGYNCLFLDNDVPLRHKGSQTTNDFTGFAGGPPPWGWDSTNYFVWEDCSFVLQNWDGDGSTNLDTYMGDTEYPANYMIRNCTFELNRAVNGQLDGFDMHSSHPQTNHIVPLGMLIYNNIFTFTTVTNVNATRIADIRGGANSLVYSNTVTGPENQDFTGTITVRDNVATTILMTNTFIWANTDDFGTMQTSAEDGVTLDTNYFTNAPASFVQLQYPHPLRRIRIAASTSRSDVLAAVNASVIGDTVIIPTGTSIWSASIVLTNGINIVGAGTNSTRLINSQTASQGLEEPIFDIDLSADNPIRIGGIYFQDENLNRNSDGIRVDIGSVHETAVVIHDCAFEGFSFANKILAAHGLTHNSYFLNNKISGRVAGYSTSDELNGHSAPRWDWGTTNYWVFEDCTFALTNWNLDSYMMGTEFPANYMVRYCDFLINRSAAVVADGFDLTGNSGDSLNDMGIVIYKNTFTYTGNNTVNPIRLVDIRGGVGSLVYSNTVSGVSIYADMRDAPFESPLMSYTYLWENYGNSGSSMSINEANGVTLNTHYFTSQPGGFAELQYPHPLRSQ